MKKYTHFLFILSIFALMGLASACHKPFEGVNAIVSNSYIKQRVSLQVLDANPSATNPYPANPVLTLSGDAVKKGLIYTGDGELLTDAVGNAKLVNNAITLAVKPYTQISDSNPIKFTIAASATGYISNSQDVVIRSADSLQYIKVRLLKPSALPVGVTNVAATNNNVANGTSKSDLVVKVITTETTAGTPVTQTQVQATFPAATVFKDNAGATIPNNNLVINITNYNSSSSAAVASISGGITNVVTSAATAPQGFILAGAVSITAELGGVPVKSFSNPIPVELFVNANVSNPDTKSNLKAGDSVPVWSKSDGNNFWVKESNVTMVNDASTGRLKAIVPVTHLSTWMIAFSQPICNQPLSINYSSLEKEVKTIFVRVNAAGGVGQLIFEKTVSVKDGDKILVDLPQDIDVVVRVYEGSNASAPLINTLNVSACAPSVAVTNNRTTSNPSLYFDLQTACKDGVFRYTGPIDYKLSSSAVWEAFTPSTNGTMTTKLLAWNQTYDFRIIYRGTEFRRSRQVLQSEFRASGDTWNYWGKTDVKQTFFNAPTSCN